MMTLPEASPTGTRRSPPRAAIGGLLGGLASGLDLLIRVLIGTRSAVLYLKLRHAEFRPRPDDVFIATYPRSGTTWMQMILYQMTTDGEMDFPHISAVCPWFERNIVVGRDLEALPSPRIFKTHFRYALLPKRPCRHIYVARDGKDVAVSLFNFYRSHFGFREDFSTFFDMFLQGRVEGGSWFDHVAGWRARRHFPGVLFLTYEELKADLEGTIRRIATFLQLDIPPDRMARIVERSSFDFMKQYESRFDHTNEVLWETGVQEHAFLRKGKSGEGAAQLSTRQQERFEAKRRRRLGQDPGPLAAADTGPAHRL